ncbi:unnamed protein product [Lupinus luteus]|uniref:Uncharacterized protein n=1 Tax=Lupinus luteus TaxID=3873 RepID=A0AAV1YHQ4_LUPLU
MKSELIKAHFIEEDPNSAIFFDVRLFEFRSRILVFSKRAVMAAITWASSPFTQQHELPSPSVGRRNDAPKGTPRPHPHPGKQHLLAL